MSKNVLVTGGSGFIGSHVVKSLIKKNYKVTVFDLTSPKIKNVRFIKGNILNKSLIEKSLKKIDIIFHLAAVSDINKVKNIPSSTVETNILGTTYLLEAARKNKVNRFIFASSVYSYGIAGNLYTSSKKSAESIIKNYNLLFKQNFTILRYGTVYGLQNRGVDAISIFIRHALKNQNLIVHGSGQQKRNYIYTEDLGNASVLAIKNKNKNKIITLASKKDIKIIDVAKLIIKLTNSKSKIILERKNKRFDDFNSEFYSSRFKKNFIKWNQKYNIKQGLKHYINSQNKN